MCVCVCVCVCVQLIPFLVHLKLRKHCKLTILQYRKLNLKISLKKRIMKRNFTPTKWQKLVLVPPAGLSVVTAVKFS